MDRMDDSFRRVPDSVLVRVVETLSDRTPMFWHWLGIGSWDKAGAILREKTTVTKTQWWSDAVSPLVKLVECEKGYAGLGFLEYSYFRKDSGAKGYEDVGAGLQLIVGMCNRVLQITKMDSKAIGNASDVGQGKSETQNVREVVEVLCMALKDVFVLIPVRISMIKLYEKISKLEKGIPNYAEIVDTTSSLLSSLNLQPLHHPNMASLRFNVMFVAFCFYFLISSEVTIVNHLFVTIIQIQAYKFKESIFSLLACKQELSQWRSEIKLKDEEENPAIISWFQVMMQNLFAKISLYFYDILNQEINFCEAIEQPANPQKLNFVSLIEAFAAKYPNQLAHVCLLYEAENVGYPVHQIDPDSNMLGYSVPVESFEPVQGLKSYPCFFSFPLDVPAPVPDHWPNIVCFISEDRATKELDKNTPVFFTDLAQKSNTTWSYFLSRIEPRVILFVLLKVLKKKNDQIVLDFFTEMKERLRFLYAFKKLVNRRK